MNASTFNIASLFEAVVDAVPDRTALVCGDTRLTFRELDDRAARLSAWMSARGVGPGTTVGVQLTNVPEHVEAALAAFKLRASPINIDYRLTANELRSLYLDAGVVGVIHGHEFDSQTREATRSLDLGWALAGGQPYESALAASSPAARIARSDDDSYILFTGGTTGYPKGVEWRIGDAFFACIGGGDPVGALGPISEPAQIVDRIVEGVAFLPAPPLIHAAGMWTTLRWLLAGAKVTLVPTFDAPTIVEAIRAEQITHMNIVGDPMAVRLLNAATGGNRSMVQSLRLIASGGAPLSEPVRQRLLAALPGVTLRDSYGSSETGVHGWATHDAQRKSDLFLTRDTVILDQETLARIPPGSPSTGFVARLRHVPLRYRNDPAASATTFIDVNGERCAVTGDIGHMDQQGRLTLYGRGTTSINSGGEKIFPEEVEAVIRQLPAVHDCLVLGVADDTWGQRVIAMVELAASLTVTETDIQNHCRAHLAGFKVPKKVHFTDQIPRTAAGKPDYRTASQSITANTPGAAR